MRGLKNTTKMIMDKPMIIFLTSVYLFLIGRIIYCSMRTTSVRAVDVPLFFVKDLAFFYFIMLIMISYEAFRKFHKHNMYEAVWAVGRSKAYTNLLIMLIMLNVILAMGIVAVSIVMSSRYVNCTIEYDIYIIKFCMLYFILTGVFAIFAGAVFAKVKKTVVGLFFVVCLCFLLSPFVQAQIAGSMENDIVTKTLNIFGIFPNYANLAMVPLTGFSISYDEWINILLLMIPFAFVYLIMYLRKYIKICMALFVLIQGVLVQQYLLPHSTWGENVSYMDAPIYYETHMPKMEAADFAVDKYTMNMKIDNQLYVECKMNLSDNSLKEYAFTLYHTFDIKSVTDGSGKKLDYVRDGDYITISSTGHEIDLINIVYKGIPDNYYVDAEAVYLSGTFAYYPRAGKYAVYNNEERRFLPSVDNSKDAYFDVTISSGTKVYSNLEESNGRYTGTAASMLLMGGFVKEVVVDNVIVYYPYLSRDDMSESAIKAMIKEVDTYPQEEYEYSLHGKKMFITEMPCAGQVFYLYDDCAEFSYFNSIKQGMDYYYKTGECF